jgi:hypothetical protein
LWQSRRHYMLTFGRPSSRMLHRTITEAIPNKVVLRGHPFPFNLSILDVHASGLIFVSCDEPSPAPFAILPKQFLSLGTCDLNFTGGQAGFGIEISQTSENFPTIPEDVRFKLTSPVGYPANSTSLVSTVQTVQRTEGNVMGADSHSSQNETW